QAERIAGARRADYGYPTACVFPDYVRVINLGTLADFPELAAHLMDGGTRFWPARPGERPRMTLFVGDPCQQGWIGSRRTRRIARVLQVGACALGAQARGTPLIWLGFPPGEGGRHWGLLCRALAGLVPEGMEIDIFCARPLEPIDRPALLS